MSRPIRSLAIASTVLVAATGTALAREIAVDINRISDAGIGEKIGTVTISEKTGGLAFKVAVKGLPTGDRGFHVHVNGDCGPAMKDGKMTAGWAAGPHYDPEAKKSHKGPKGAGHKGDLPLLKSTATGIDETVTAPRLKLADVQGRALMIHESGDNYSDHPENGGGAGRIACGVVPKQ